MINFLRLVEHHYDAIKHWMGSTHLLMKRLPNVHAEMSLLVVAYNLRRAINVLGIPKIIEQLQALNGPALRLAAYQSALEQ
jgi:transposase